MASSAGNTYIPAQLTPEQEHERLQAHASAIEALTRSVGWAVFVQAALRAKDAAEQGQKTAEVPHQLGIQVGIALGIKDLLDWPRREMLLAKQRAIQNAANAAKAQGGPKPR